MVSAHATLRCTALLAELVCSQIFESFDKDGDGVWNRAELQSVMRAYGYAAEPSLARSRCSMIGAAFATERVKQVSDGKS